MRRKRGTAGVGRDRPATPTTLPTGVFGVADTFIKSVGLEEADPRQRATLHPLVEGRNPPRAVGTMAVVELVDEVTEHATPLGRIGDDLGLGGQVGDNAVLQVKGE